MFPRIFALILFVLGCSAAELRAEDAGAHRADRVLVKYKEGQAPPGDGRPHGTVIKRLGKLGIEVIRVTDGSSVATVLGTYRADASVKYAQPDFVRTVQALANDPGVPEEDAWHLNNDGRELGVVGADIKAASAWDIRHDAPGVIVAVLDTGIRYTHEDLAANMWRNVDEIPADGLDNDANGIIDDYHGANLINETGAPMDDEGHGTFVAGLIGAVGNNGVGVTGVCWDVSLMAVKVLDGVGSGSDSTIIEGMEYARAEGADIINASLGIFSDPSPAMQDAVDALEVDGVVLVVAAGNSSFDNDYDLNLTEFPSSFANSNVISVAATTRNDLLSTFSSYGWRSVDLGAPGVLLPSTDSESDSAYDTGSGTSFSAPLVAGAMALLRAHLPDATTLELINRLLRSVDPQPGLAGRCTTGGRLNLRRALEGGAVAPVNDAFANAVVLGSDVYFSGSAVTAACTTEPGEPSVGSNGKTAWFEWTAPYTGRVVVRALPRRQSVGSAAFDSLITAYLGTSLESLQRIGGNLASGSPAETFTFEAAFRQTYYFRLEGSAASDGISAFAGRYELAPDGFGPFTYFSLESIGAGSVTPAKLLGDSVQRRGAKMKLTAKPASNYILFGWVDPRIKDREASVLSREPNFTYTIPQSGIGYVQAVFVFNPFRELAGTYNGLVSPETGGASGFWTMKLGATGAFTATLLLDGQRHQVKGTLRSDRKFQTTLKRGQLTVEFKLSGERRITGAVTDRGAGFTLLAEAGGQSLETNPALQAGTYTVQLVNQSGTLGSPEGSGYGLLTVSRAGSVRFSGALGDGRKASQGAWLFRTGHFPLYFAPYKRGGSLAGLVNFVSTSDSDLNGTADWTKNPDARDKTYPAGFAGVVVRVQGARYAFPQASERIIPLANTSPNAVLEINGGGMGALSFPLTIDQNNGVSSNGDVQMTIYTSTGEFAALIPYQNSYRVVRGMVSRAAGFGLGYCLNGSQSAAVTLRSPD